MARTLLAETALNTRAGFVWPGTESAADAPNGNYFVYGPRKLLSARNTTGSPVNITFTPDSSQLDGMTATAKVVSLPANSQSVFALSKVYAQRSDGDRVYIDCPSASVSLKTFDVATG